METTQRSGGPRTEEGKARSSMNALRHGFRSKSALLPGEDPEKYYELKAKLENEWTPVGETEKFCLSQLLFNQWRLNRIAILEEDVFVQSFESSFGQEFDANQPGALTAALGNNQLTLLTRYENSIRRAYYKALSELRTLQAERRKAEQAEQKAAHDAHVRRLVGQMESDNAAMNQQLIAMCEDIPATPNDGYKFIKPRPSGSFGSKVEAPKEKAG